MKSCPILSDSCFVNIAIFLIYYCKCFQKINHCHQSLYMLFGRRFVVDGKKDRSDKIYINFIL